MTVERNRAAGATALTTVMAPMLWGTTYITITQLLPPGRPLLVASMRVLPAGIALLVVARLSSPWRPRGAEWGRTVVLALCNFGFFFPLLAVAVYRLPGGVAAAAGGFQPLLVLSLTFVITRHRPSRRDLAVGAAAAIGVALVVIRPHADIDAVGVLAALAANVSFAMGVVLTKRFPPAPNRLASTAWQLLLGGALLVPLMLVVEGAPPAVSARNVAGFAYLSLVGTAFAFVLWFNGIRKLPTAAPPLLGLASPIMGASIGWLALGQALSPIQLLGFAVTISAIAYGAVLSTARLGEPSSARLHRWHIRNTSGSWPAPPKVPRSATARSCTRVPRSWEATRIPKFRCTGIRWRTTRASSTPATGARSVR